MKNYRIILFITFFAFLFSGCEDFLERQPTDRIVSEAFWTNETDAYMALMGVYSRLYEAPFGNSSNWPYGAFWMIESLTDNAYSGGGDYNEIALGLVYPTTGLVSSWSNNCYRGVASCNFFLDNIDRVPDIVDDLKNQYIAEVRFLRAWLYFYLQQTYGGVIIYETIPTVEGSKVKQSTSEEVLSFVLQDIDAAIPYLPDDSYTGRIVKNSAHAFKAKVLLFDEQWAESAEEANIVMTSGKCSLYPDYRKLFLSAPQQSNPDEILFSTLYAYPDVTNTAGQARICWGAQKPRKELLDAYLCIDGLPTDESPLFDPGDPYSNRDPRCLQTVNPTLMRVIDGDTSHYESETGIMWNKFIEDDWSYYITEQHDDYDVIHLRYADVLLMYAEAQNEAVGPDQSVYDAINEVRARSNMPPVAPGLSVDEMRETIRLERRIELVAEGQHRWFDIKRWGIANDVLQAVDEPGKGVGALRMPSHQYIWPFPQTEIDLNPNLVQKPGY